MLQKILTWFLGLSRLGVLSDSEDGVSRRIVLSNVVFISLPIVYIIFMVIDYESYLLPINQLRFDQFVVPIIILVCIFCLFLNKLHNTMLSRLLFLTLWPFLLHIIPIALLKTPSDYYIAFPSGIIFHALLIQLMFSHRKEAILFWLYFGVNFITMIFVADILIYFDTNMDFPRKIVDDKYYLYDGILYWLLFNLVMFYVLLVIEMYIKKLNTSLFLIENNKEELTILNENLEKIVSARTSELKDQHNKIREYAFYNAHLLRGPFCRIQGLIQLQEMIKGSLEEENEIRDRLKDSIEELDAIIREIQHIVQTGG